MHEKLLAQALFPEPVVVLGLRLRPYSLWHDQALKDVAPEVLEAIDPDQVSIQQLARAVFICCHTFREYESLDKDPLLSLKIFFWKLRVWASRPDPRKEAEKFIWYRIAGSREFPLSNTIDSSKARQGRLMGVPFGGILFQFLTREMRLTPEQAWDHPFGLAKMEWMVEQEARGLLDIYNAHDAETDRYVAEMEAKAAAEASAKKGDA